MNNDKTEGTPENLIKKMLIHKGINFTINYYAHSKLYSSLIIS